ncbi:MAG: Fe-S-binding domain-containing protein, partial [Acidimicrobiia bacterium]|nr:Fe-S-binding domain-containing protein [Acidimicrobiia bacterium]
MGNFPILTAIILTPFAGALVTMVLPRRRPEYVRIVGFATTAATLGFAGAMLYSFHTHFAGYQFVENTPWIGSLGVSYHLGVDGISLFMVVLTALLFPLGLLGAGDIEERLKGFTVWMLLLESALLGVFLALDLVLFFVFFEIVLVPMYFIIGQWGHGRRVYAATKFFLYTMTGSAFLLVGLLSVAFLHQASTGKLTFDLPTLMQWTSSPGNLSSVTSKALFLAFFAAFAVKVPLFPFHTWLPDA